MARTKAAPKPTQKKKDKVKKGKEKQSSTEVKETEQEGKPSSKFYNFIFLVLHY